MVGWDAPNHAVLAERRRPLIDDTARFFRAPTIRILLCTGEGSAVV